MEDLDKEMVEVKIVIEGGKHSEDETDNWVDHICVEMPTHPDLVKMYGAGRPNELRMLYLMNQQNLEIFSAYGDETPDEQKQQRRLVNAFKEVVEETNGNALVDIESSIIDEMNDRIDEGEFGIHDVDPHAIVRFMAEDYNRFRWEKPSNPAKWNEYWDKILHDTWSHNEYFDIVCEILYKKYPLEDHESHADPWAEPVVKTAEEMRDLIDKLGSYWKTHIRKLLSLE